MAAPLTAGLAPNLELRGGYILRVTALDPTTGAVNTDVVVSDVALQVEAATPIVPFVVPSLPPVVTYGAEAPGLTR